MTDATKRRVRYRVRRIGPKVARGLFDESVGLDDRRPFPEWLPSPNQILKWAAQVREENNERAGLTKKSDWERRLDGKTQQLGEMLDDQ